MLLARHSTRVAGALVVYRLAFSTAHNAPVPTPATTTAATTTTATTTPRIVVYQYKICPFCNRVKSLLDYVNVPYDTVEVNPLTKSQVKFTEKKKVPVVVIEANNGNGNTSDSNSILLEDSGKIIQYFLQANYASTSGDSVVVAATTKANSKTENKATLAIRRLLSDDSEQWMEWSEKKLAVMLYPNITRSYDESWECFEYANHVKEWSWIEQKTNHVVGAFFMSLANGKIKKKYNIVDERKELMLVLDEWINAVGDKKFLHGNEVTLPDLMVFGVLKSIHGLQTFNEIMQQKTPLQEWYLRVDKQIIANQQGSTNSLQLSTL